MSNTIFIDSLTKCRFESIFGDGTYWGCLTIAKLITAISLLPGEKLDARDKWDDLAGWLGIKDKLIFVKNYKEGLKWWKDVGSKVKVSEDSLDKLMDCFPYGGYL